MAGWGRNCGERLTLSSAGQTSNESPPTIARWKRERCLNVPQLNLADGEGPCAKIVVDLLARGHKVIFQHNISQGYIGHHWGQSQIIRKSVTFFVYCPKSSRIRNHHHHWIWKFLKKKILAKLRIKFAKIKFSAFFVKWTKLKNGDLIAFNFWPLTLQSESWKFFKLSSCESINCPW